MSDLALMENQEKMLYAHGFLVRFLEEFDVAKRGGMHDVMELSLYNMISTTIGNIDSYLKDGHKAVSAQEIISIFIDSSQKVLDVMKRNLEGMHGVNFK